MLFEQNFRNHLRAFKFLLISTCLLLMVWWISGHDLTLLKYLGVFLLLTALPALYLHLEYYSRNRYEKFFIGDFTVTKVKKGVTETWHYDELENVTFYMTPGKFHRSARQILPQESYNYAKLLLKDGRELIITCLLYPDLEEFQQLFKGVSRVQKQKAFCSIDPI